MRPAGRAQIFADDDGTRLGAVTHLSAAAVGQTPIIPGYREVPALVPNEGIIAVKISACRRVSETNTTPQSLLRRAAVSILAVFLLLLGTSGAALAHDQVTGTSPSDGSTVATAPEKIDISMTNTPAAIGSQVLVVDEAGTNWAEGEVSVLDRVATQAVRPGAPAGKYTVKWRLVSADSHPVDGEFTFTATAAGGSATSAANTGNGVGAGPVASVSAEPQAAPTNAVDESPVPWSVIGLIVVLVGLVVAMVVVARRRLSRED